MAKVIRKEEISAKILFSDVQSKDLFLRTIEEYSVPLENLMKQISPALGVGETEPNIVVDISNNLISVEATIADKGVVLSKDGYDKYSSIKPGSRYASLVEGKLCLFEKVEVREDGFKPADIAIGFAPSINEAIDSLSKTDDINLSKVRESKK